ncbi:MAG: tetratricopeptide repeat protein, partial [Cyanobacteria bacterium SZAS LIN-2]|nr:tetratricopeptide repeat protein [Cyanobacteria bacterium SZAS LIN-2]
KSLLGAGMIEHAEQMILRAKEVYISLLGPADTVVGDLDMRLADCYQRRQRLAAERPVLVEALNIYEKSTQPNSRRYVEALLKLGELDRTVNRYEIAKTELSDALNIAQKHFPQDTNLNCECLNAYACYFSELGKDKEAKELFDRASKLKLTDLIEE